MAHRSYYRTHISGRIATYGLYLLFFNSIASFMMIFFAKDAEQVYHYSHPNIVRAGLTFEESFQSLPCSVYLHDTVWTRYATPTTINKSVATIRNFDYIRFIHIRLEDSSLYYSLSNDTSIINPETKILISDTRCSTVLDSLYDISVESAAHIFSLLIEPDDDVSYESFITCIDNTLATMVRKNCRNVGIAFEKASVNAVKKFYSNITIERSNKNLNPNFPFCGVPCATSFMINSTSKIQPQLSLIEIFWDYYNPIGKSKLFTTIWWEK